MIFPRICFLDKDEQLIINGLTETTVIDGPCMHFVPMWVKSIEQKKALTLTQSQYCVVKNILSGEKRVEAGPKLLFLKAYDHIVKNEEGDKRREAISLKANEYVRLLDELTGQIRVIYGEKGCVIPRADEKFLDGDKFKAIQLQVFEYVKIQNTKTGAVRTVRGEQLVFLGEFDFQMGVKRKAIEVDQETAVLVRDKSNGQQRLVTKQELFFPGDNEEIIEVRNLTRLADHEACILRDNNGQESVMYGSNEKERSFFVPPFHEIVSLRWSRGRRRERRDLEITKLDLRPMYMSFEFNTRTSDNVELVLEGSFFWEIVDLVSMLKFTNDTTGDVCNHARSRFIEKISKVTLQEFMSKFNAIAEEVHKDDESSFYLHRGVKIHSLEVTGYRCAEPSTARILEMIIQETTSRMNRLQQQESINEINLAKLSGEIEEEKSKAELLKIQATNSDIQSTIEGKMEAQKVKSFLSELQSASFPDVDMAALIEIWNTLRKEDALRAVANENCRIYYTPNDVNLSIEN
jgi:hypothetical protein